MKTVIVILVVLLAGCSEAPTPQPSRYPDQALRREIFEMCLKTVPAGPAQTKYNDWDEVVAECGSQAYYLALQLPDQPKEPPK